MPKKIQKTLDIRLKTFSKNDTPLKRNKFSISENEAVQRNIEKKLFHKEIIAREESPAIANKTPPALTLRINLLELIKQDINPEKNINFLAKINSQTKLPSITFLPLIKAILDDECKLPRTPKEYALLSTICKATKNIFATKLAEQKNEIIENIANHILDITRKIKYPATSFFKSEYNHLLKFYVQKSASIINKLDPKYINFKLTQAPEDKMAAISLLLIAFDTSSIDAYCSAQTKKRPIKLEFAGKSREEMVRLAHVLNHVKFRSNLVELNLSGCIFDRSTFFEIMAHLKKYPSLTLFNLSNAKICRDLGLTEYAQELQKLNKLMPNLKIIVDSPQT